MSDTQRPSFGLYLHIPYCRALCPYCDFAKTANFGSELVAAYISTLEWHLRHWLAAPGVKDRLPFTSVFLGGGTPSLLSEEYHHLFSILKPFLAATAELTLEANPDDINAHSLATWRALGINRLSIGVQTFAEHGLKVLKRTHSGAAAHQAITEARAVFTNVNIDLIYGWPGQTMATWEADLLQALDLDVPHLSLYSLTFESRTPLGRAFHRGQLIGSACHDDDAYAEFYATACRMLSPQGGAYVQDEVSNWSRPGFTCQHNWLYWQDSFYLAIGAGAHGYLPGAAIGGLRYAYERNDRKFIKHAMQENLSNLQDIWEQGFAAGAMRLGVQIDGTRTADSWLLEVIGSGLRCARGVDLYQLEAGSGRRFQATPVLTAGLDAGYLNLDSTGRLMLSPAEWFRESGWCVAVAQSFGL